MKTVARSLFCWQGLDRDIEQRAANCGIFVANFPVPAAAPPVNWPETQEKWYWIHTDFAGHIAEKMALVVVDEYSKWTEVISMNYTNVESTIRALRSIFARFGVPRTIVSVRVTAATLAAHIKVIFLQTYGPACKTAGRITETSEPTE